MSEDEPKSYDQAGTDPAAKLKELRERIKQAAAQNSPKAQASTDVGRLTGQIGLMRIGTDFASAVLGATGVGWLLDYGLGTAPWGMLIMLLVGFCTGVLTIWRALQKSGSDETGP